MREHGSATAPLRATADAVRRQLAFLGGETAHGLVHEGALLGLLLLGRKESGTYTPEDLNLLTAFAQITALALVSTEGHRTIDALNRELLSKVEKIAEQHRRIVALQSQLASRRAPAVAAAAERTEAPPAAADGLIGSSAQSAAAAAFGAEGGRRWRPSPAARRKRHGKGAAGSRHSRQQPAGRQAVRQGPLQRPRGQSAGK